MNVLLRALGHAGAALVLCSAGATAIADTPRQIMARNGFSEDSIRQAEDFVGQVQEIARTIAPTARVTVSEAGPVRADGSGLEAFIAGPIPEKASLAKIAGAESLTRDNYAKLVEALFADAEPRQKARWQKKLDDYAKAGKDAVIDDWFKRFNALARQMVHGSREEYRRGLIASLSLADFPTLSEAQQKLAPQIVMSHAGEYLLMSAPKIRLVRIEHDLGNGPLSNLIVPESAVDALAFARGQKLVSDTFAEWQSRARKTVELAQKEKEAARGAERVARKEEAVARIEERVARKEEAVARIEERVARKEEAVARIEEVNKAFGQFANSADQLTRKITLIESPANRKDEKLRAEIGDLSRRFEREKAELDRVLKQNDADKAFVDERKRSTNEQLYNTIRATLRAYRIID